MTTTNRTIEIEHVAIADLRPDPFNPRRISDGELERSPAPAGSRNRTRFEPRGARP